MANSNSYATLLTIFRTLLFLSVVAAILATLWLVGAYVFFHLVRFLAWDFGRPDLVERYSPDGWTVLKIYSAIAVTYYVAGKLNKIVDDYETAEKRRLSVGDPYGLSNEKARKKAYLAMQRRIVFGPKADENSKDQE